MFYRIFSKISVENFLYVGAKRTREYLFVELSIFSKIDLVEMNKAMI